MKLNNSTKVLLFLIPLLVGVYLISPHRVHAAGDCPPPNQDFTDTCQEDDPPQPDPEGSDGTTKTVTTGLSSDGRNDPVTALFLSVFPGNWGQVYQIDWQILQNDNPSPGIEFCVNNTSAWGDGFCNTVQTYEGSPGDDTGSPSIVTGGIDSLDYTYYSHLVVRLKVHQTFFNENDVQVKWTMHRREFTSLDSSSLLTPSIATGVSPQFSWTTTGTVPSRQMFMEGPNGIGGFWDDSDGMPEDTESWSLPIALNTPGTYIFSLRVAGPARMGGEDFRTWDTIVTVQSSGGSPPGAFSLTNLSCFNWPNPEVEVNSSQSSGAVTYTLERRQGSGSWAVVASNLTYAELDQYADSVSKNQTYEYHIIASNPSGSTTSSNTLSISATQANCGGPPPVAPTASISANPNPVDNNTASTVSWSSTNASSCTVAQTGWTGTSGSQSTGNLTAASTYTVNCTGAGGSASDSVTVDVNSAPPPPTAPTCTSATPDEDSVYTTAPTRRTYANGVVNATNVWFPTFTDAQGGAGAVWYPGAILSGNEWYVDIPVSGNLPASHVNVHVYMTNANFSNQWCDSANFNVTVPPAGPTVWIKANGQPTSITISNNTAADITWGSANVTSCSVSPGGWTGTSGSNSTGNLTATTTYTVNCDNGAATASVTVNVNAPSGMTCTSATPDSDSISTAQSTRRTFANGVSGNTGMVYFPAWTDTGGQDDLIWYEGNILSGNQWYYDIPMSAHPGTGGVNVHVYLWNGSAGFVWCDSANFTVTASASLVFGITYTALTLNEPTGVSVSNIPCQTITTTWSYSNNGVENGFYVYRSIDGATWGSPISGLLGTGVRSYQDTPPQTNVRYYYRVSAHRGVVIDPLEAYSGSANAMNVACVANLSSSSKALIRVNGAAYSGTTVIKDGDTLTYQITIVNDGPANATVNYICDNASGNLTDIRNLSVSGSGSASSGISQNNAACLAGGNSGLRFNVSGIKNIANNWLVTFDATFTASASSGSQEIVTNCGVVYYTDSEARSKIACAPTIIVNKNKGQVPSFREVAP
ncbi:MAG: hypothetical protein A3J07_02135 [Candidatus Doudnabacteria bacterium RIFCSPLOWO2_02_FULL_49_13]|uniref:DUF11 domain-containing protein n=1 Tax=Candidatus Doudnabacteria bacterium RIFCSPHIGHO2_12_FULL_48_16 TaxID=1817838 RepID=A0A1F5PLB7_9BACT|nr:MAG: hypothetical protein A3B77_00575 [Candidatus Doudnabacteria bacterium RIFCSPHIGHO2_02_FULL_49_24]OGE89666.1 MAG: hypothetical protein A2760_00680 [Candidatus Doudnabacteria bacterium RIFCSPHIGHO2_01_FULL_50_67]OGE90733.1 MAG: hypothetical protein A3E29_01235 [Candidatus Doudnabacteria bacterium RIFCSPHIGHO2_12_FULL_48_16]OGE96845.1 MAG: hypothetical protein A2990_03345 [Candidatus Doudnabacteria bacterium RIFCSPLOWO2_01_FULL_49_40]OGF02596.1 MAG: hypothetical protein A3J07_02135 [Candid